MYFVRLTVKPRTANIYESANGEKPYENWLRALKDKRAQAKIAARVDRAEIGNFGKYRELQNGVYEIKEDFGPGYRVYFGIDGDEIILLLCGGDKGSQGRDIERAKKFWKEYNERKKL